MAEDIDDRRSDTSVAEASFTGNSGTGVNDNSTFAGYTVQQIVKALQLAGILAQMAPGDLTASTPTIATTPAEIKTQIDNLNLAAVTDKIAVVPFGDVSGKFLVFKVERA